MLRIIWIALFLASGSARAAAGSLNMDISFELGEGLAPSAKEWTSVCQAVGEAAKVGQGMWGYGIIANYRCLKDKKVIFGDKKLDTQLEFKIVVGDEGFEIYLLYKYPENVGSKKFKEGTFSKVLLDLSDDNVKALKDPKVTVPLLTLLFDKAPAAAMIKPTDSTIALQKSDATMKPPAKIAAFTMEFEAKTGYIMPRLVGRLNFKSTSGKLHLYNIEYVNAFAFHGQALYLQNADGAGKKALAIEKRLNQFLKKYHTKVKQDTYLLSSISTGYAGFRYGYPLTTGDPVVSKSAMVSIFTEVRGGPLEGLRWYYDFAPETKSTTAEGQNLSFTWSRPTLGWAFSFELLSSPVGEFSMDITPKIGLMDFDATLPVPGFDGEAQTAKFRVKNSLTLGIDGGITWEAKWFLLRGWGATDLAGLYSVSNDGVNISSIRGGLDSFWDMFEIFDTFELSLIVFAGAEKISIERKTSAEDAAAQAESNETLVSGVSYVTAFAGLGATIQW